MVVDVRSRHCLSYENRKNNVIYPPPPQKKTLLFHNTNTKTIMQPVNKLKHTFSLELIVLHTILQSWWVEIVYRGAICCSQFTQTEFCITVIITNTEIFLSLHLQQRVCKGIFMSTFSLFCNYFESITSAKKTNFTFYTQY